MEKGKKICAVLKDIRQKIADANEIKYAPHECHHEGPCAGTCPACEAEVKYLEEQLNARRLLGKRPWMWRCWRVTCWLPSPTAPILWGKCRNQPTASVPLSLVKDRLQVSSPCVSLCILADRRRWTSSSGQRWSIPRKP